MEGVQEICQSVTVLAGGLLTDGTFFAMLGLLRERNKHEYYLHLRDEGLLTLHPHVQDFMCEGACHI